VLEGLKYFTESRIRESSAKALRDIVDKNDTVEYPKWRFFYLTDQ